MRLPDRKNCYLIASMKLTICDFDHSLGINRHRFFTVDCTCRKKTVLFLDRVIFHKLKRVFYLKILFLFCQKHFHDCSLKKFTNCKGNTTTIWKIVSMKITLLTTLYFDTLINFLIEQNIVPSVLYPSILSVYIKPLAVNCHW